MLQNKNILIACYYFPPYPGIGGRRTAKFCKYLLKMGYCLHVIRAENPYSNSSNWLNEINHPNLFIYELPLQYPRSLLIGADTQGKKNTFLNRLINKFIIVWFNNISSKRLYDLTVFWEDSFVKLCKEIIDKNDIKNCIVSVSPHYYAYYMAKLKSQLKSFNYIVDFRDPWLTLRDFGMQEMSKKQRDAEMQKVKFVSEQANYLISPSMFVLDEFKPFCNDKDKCIEITHAYDYDDIKSELNYRKDNKEDFVFIYPGTLYTDVEPSLVLLYAALQHLKENKPDLYCKIKIHFYVDEHKYKSIFHEHSNVCFFKPVGKEIFTKVAKSDCVLILYAEHNKNYRTTKFYEFLPFRKPYLYIGPKGDTFNFILKNKLGSSVALPEKESLVKEIVGLLDAAEFKPGLSPDTFSFEHQTKLLADLFI